MDFLLLQSLVSFLLIITSFTLISVELSLCADDPQYANCSQVINCGGRAADISYPFWGVNRPNYCGEPGLEVQCQGLIPVITSMNTNLTILKMNSGSPRTVKVATQGYWDNFCADNFTHTPFNFSLFNYPTSGLRNATFYYSCNLYPTNISNLASCSKASNMNNTSSSVNYYSFYTFSTSADHMPPDMACANEVVVPVSETAAVALENGQGKIQDALDEGFELGLKINNDQCNNCEGSGGKCGYNMSESGFICFCRDQPHANTCDINSTTTTTTTSGSSSSSMLRDLVIGISAGVSGIIIITLCIICISRKRMVFFKKYEDNEFDVEAFIRNNGSLTPKRYSYSKVKKMTNSFKDKIGKGGYGVVYKGKLPDGLIVAVKVLIESKGNGEDFINEVASIGTTSHVNVITLLGFCYEKDKRALIYQYMPNGSLDNFIRNCGSSNANCRLEWETLSEIAVGIARGLHYLHRGCNTRILHFDIKPQNILLDNDFCPKISDFGLSKLCKTKESIVSMMGTRGTVGYIAPEVFSRNFGGVSHKSDVYSYGMLVLEMIGARKNLDSGVSHTSEMFPHYIYKDLELDKDENIFGTISEEEKERARKMILISLWCIQTNPSDRPSMRKVVEMLEGPLHSLPIPPKPLLFSPTRAVDESMTTTQPSETSQGN